MSNFYELFGYTLRIDVPRHVSNAANSSSLSPIQFNYFTKNLEM